MAQVWKVLIHFKGIVYYGSRVTVVLKFIGTYISHRYTPQQHPGFWFEVQSLRNHRIVFLLTSCTELQIKNRTYFIVCMRMDTNRHAKKSCLRCTVITM